VRPRGDAPPQAACAALLILALASVGQAIAGPPAPPAPTAAVPPAGTQAPAGSAAPMTLRFAPKARRLSTYTADIRLETTTREVTFEAPQAYQQSFAFWSNRMKGQKKSELIELITYTQDVAEDGTIPFRRTVPRFQVEFMRAGQPSEPYGTLPDDVKSQVWEGSLDPLGNLKEMRKTAGKDNADIASLSLPLIQRAFPEAPAARDLKAGESFVETMALPLPEPLHIAGLEEIGMRVAREYTLKEVNGERAVFGVTVTYANDPAASSKAAGTTCTLSGGGEGTAEFDVRRGVFLAFRVPSTLKIDIVAPLRPLPEHPEMKEGGSGKTHIEIDLLLSAQQIVKRVWGEESD